MKDAQLAATASSLARELVAAAGDEAKESVAFKLAIEQFMSIQGAPAGADPAEFMCAEFFAEGGTESESVFDQMGDIDDEERERLWTLLADAAGYERPAFRAELLTEPS